MAQRSSLAALAVLGLAITGCHAPHKNVVAHQQPSIEQFIKIQWPFNAELSKNGNFYYIDLVDGVRQLHRRSRDARSGMPITEFEDGIGGYSISPDGNWIAITAGVGGNEQYDIYLMDARSEEMEPLYTDPQSVFGSIVWRDDSMAFAYRANTVVKDDFNVFVHDMERGTSDRVYYDSGYWYPVDFSPDGSALAIAKYVSASESYVHWINFERNDVHLITWADDTWSFDPVGYIEDGTKFLVITDYEDDRKRLFTIDVKNGELVNALPQFSDYDMDYAVLNRQRDLIGCVVNIDGYAELHVFSLPDFTPVDLPDIPKGIVGNVRIHDRTLLYSLNNANTPGLIYRWEIDMPDRLPVQLTRARTQGIDVSRFKLPRLVKFNSFDGLEVPAFLYLPPDYQAGRSIPFIVSYHGGPESQYRPYFSSTFQYYLSRGFGVLAPNVRGSSGYGTAYLEMDNYKNRMDSVRDGVAAAQWLIDNGYSAPGMIGAYGGSYGGFMVMAVITQAPEVYGAACNVVGIVNFQTFLERTKAYRRKLREAEYGPLTDPEFLRSISPIYLVDRIQTPLLIAHGRNDPRVPVHEAEQLYEALIELDRNPELLVFEDEGHGFRKMENRIVFYKTLADFFQTHLKRAM